MAFSSAALRLSLSPPVSAALEPQGDGPRLEAQKGQFLRMLCAADSRPPATLSWALEDRVVSWSRPSGSGGLELVLPEVTPGDAGRYTCRAENRLGFLNRTLNLSVQFTENLGNGTPLPVLEGQNLHLLCVAHSNPPASLSWARGGQTLQPSQPSDLGVLELPQIQREHEGEFTCHAQNPLGSQHVSLSLSVVYPPQLLGPSCSWEDARLHCSCSSHARPAPSLRWRLGEQLLEGNLSNASLTVTSSSVGPWANSSLSLRGQLCSDLRLSCEAQNVLGAPSATVLLLPGLGACPVSPGDQKAAFTGAFSNGAILGAGVSALCFCLCLIVVITKTLRKKQSQVETGTQAETQRPRPTRRSTILDYVNVVPGTRHLARSWKAKRESPSQTPPADVNSLQPKDNQKRRHVSHGSPGPRPSRQVPESKNEQDEIHYAALDFPGLRPWEIQESQETNSEYAEIRFH
ncbi:Sialic acid-binding Ig-like lectin 10 [Pteropus alecto]|uniref:Sialic acid-binding Ig-like lectin 10 n=1 Tax=Pteropus alecto TaxID=9402 RepID=L5L5D6_PTEAL|nr:Sialic acid-binding Ig-like lectin 10 [Pteropus alecto]